MRYFLCGLSTTLFSIATVANAADFQSSQALRSDTSSWSWSGAYIGTHLSNAVLANDWKGADGALAEVVPFAGQFTGGGIAFGLQAGFNYQFANNVVLGLEADLQFADIGSNNLLIGGPVGGAFASQSLDTYGTIRARMGYAMDRFLPYITGGAAWANTSYTGPFGWTADSTHWGWTIGGGLEYAVTNNWTVKGEYQYLSFDGDSHTYLNGDTVKTKYDMSVLKAGVNYKF